MNRSDISSREFRNRIVGKTISSVVARPGKNGEPPVVLMLQFEDGSVEEFVSPRSDRLLKTSLQERLAEPAAIGAESASEHGHFELAQLPLPGCGAGGLN